MSAAKHAPEVTLAQCWPAPAIWRTTYAHERRAHRHRCCACRRILETGDAVWMARVANKTTHAIHESCGDGPFGAGEWTQLEALGVHATIFVKPNLLDADLLRISRAAIAKATGSAS